MQMLFMPDIRVTPTQMSDAKNVNIMVLQKVRHTGFCQFVSVNEDFALIDGWDELKAWRSLGFVHVHGTVMANRNVQSDSYVRLGKDEQPFYRDKAARNVMNAFDEGVKQGIRLQKNKEHAQIAARLKDEAADYTFPGVDLVKEAERIQNADEIGFHRQQAGEEIRTKFGNVHKCRPEVEAFKQTLQTFHSKQADKLMQALMGQLEALLIRARNVGRDDAKRELVERLKGVVD